MYYKHLNRKRVTIREEPEVRYIEKEDLIVKDRDGEFDFEKLSKEIDEFVGSIGVLEKELEICAVANRKVRITVDSGAAESVSPVDFFEEFMLDPVKPGKQMRLVNASGGKINHIGERKVALRTGEIRLIGLPFQVCDVKKPLVSVKRICEKGNITQFGPKKEDNFIMNVKTEEKIWLIEENGQYMMEANLETDSPF